MPVRVYTVTIWLGDDEEPLTEYLVCDGRGPDIASLSQSVAGAVARLLGAKDGRLVSEAEASEALDNGAEEFSVTLDGSELGEDTPSVVGGTVEGRDGVDGDVFVAIGRAYTAATSAYHHRTDADRDLGQLLGTSPRKG